MNGIELMNNIESGARTYASTFQTVFDRGAGVRMRDQSGREIIDCLACAGALPLGHNHPEIREALIEFINSGHVQQVLDLTTPAKVELRGNCIVCCRGNGRDKRRFSSAALADRTR